MKFLPAVIVRSPLFPTHEGFREDQFLEALYLSSPVLYEEYLKYRRGELSDPKDIRKMEVSLYKYRLRSSRRCTPFGLFAGLGIGQFGEQNRVTVANTPEALSRKTRLDMNVVCSLAQELEKHPALRPWLRYHPNSSLYRIGNSYRYVEYYYIENRRIHKINKVDHSEYLEFLLEAAKKKMTRQDMIDLLVSDDISAAEAGEFIEELIGAQLLVSQLEPTVSGTDFFDVLVAQLREIHTQHPDPAIGGIISLLEDVGNALKQLDQQVFNTMDAYRQILNRLRELMPDLAETNLFQTDLYKRSENLPAIINTEIQSQLKQVIQFLDRIKPAEQITAMQDFIRQFADRYEDQEVPLLIAIDKETGIGYPDKDNSGINLLIEDVFAKAPASGTDIRWTHVETCLLRLLERATQHSQRIVEIKDSDFPGIDFTGSSFAPSLPVMFNVLDAEKNIIVFNLAGGSSAINLLGRFAGGDDRLLDITREIARHEEQQLPGKILAEIIHLPESRTGNILARPVFRTYEIPYLAQPAVDAEHQLPADDLTVCIRDNRIILRSRRLNKEIIPRLGNAHNYRFGSLPLYHFLCDLQFQYIGRSMLSFQWGTLENQFTFLPRAVYRNTILSPARWYIRKPDIEKLLEKNLSDAQKLQRFEELRQRLRLDEQFMAAEGDNELYIDTRDPIAVFAFLDMIRGKNEMIMEECLFGDGGQALVTDTEGRPYTNECIALLLHEAVQTAAESKPVVETPAEVKQVFIPGSEWLYFKIYCGVKTADAIVADILQPFADELIREGHADKWFFIRYGDPANHLRFRLHLPDTGQTGPIITRLHDLLHPLLSAHLISNLQTDTYKRELVRYGRKTIELAESVFYHDSVFVAGMLTLLDPELGGEIRWKIALRSVDSFLEDFELRTEKKLRITQQLADAFFQEHGGEKELQVTLDKKFRSLRPSIEDVLRQETDEEKEYHPILEMLRTRSEAVRPIARQLLTMHREGNLELPLDQLLASYMHMNLDRLFMGRNRTNEYVVYALLAKQYKSALAREKAMEKNQITHS